MVDVFGGGFLPLDAKWNRLFRTKTRDPPADLRGGGGSSGDCVWHFTGTPKPWESGGGAPRWAAALWRRYDPGCPRRS
jgi:lipopolysaccharide biosynthesis glycosyltransferase